MFEGKIGSVKVYSRELSQSEIYAIYKRTKRMFGILSRWERLIRWFKNGVQLLSR